MWYGTKFRKNWKHGQKSAKGNLIYGRRCRVLHNRLSIYLLLVYQHQKYPKMSVTPTPQRILREGEVGQLVGFSRTLKWKWAKISQDFQLAIYQNRPINLSIKPTIICNLNGTSITWGYFEGSKEPVLRFTLIEPTVSVSSNGGLGCCGCLDGVGGSQSTKDLTLILHSSQELCRHMQ